MAWRWLSEAVVLAMHGEVIAQHGGEDGIRDSGMLSSALARPLHKVSYDEPSVFDLAAAYSFGLIQNHPFIDGNKRTGFLAAYVFLQLNGFELTAPEGEAVAAVLSLAKGDMSEDEFSTWLQSQSAARTDSD